MSSRLPVAFPLPSWLDETLTVMSPPPLLTVVNVAARVASMMNGLDCRWPASCRRHSARWWER